MDTMDTILRTGCSTAMPKALLRQVQGYRPLNSRTRSAQAL